MNTCNMITTDKWHIEIFFYNITP